MPSACLPSLLLGQKNGTGQGQGVGFAAGAAAPLCSSTCWQMPLCSDACVKTKKRMPAFPVFFSGRACPEGSCLCVHVGVAGANEWNVCTRGFRFLGLSTFRCFN